MNRKQIQTLFVVLAVSSSASAATSTSTSDIKTDSSSLANIQEGNINVGGYLDFVKTTGDSNDSFDYSTAITAKYFLIDRLALGLDFGLDGGSTQKTAASLGPAATYYFWKEGKVATYAGAAFRLGLSDATVNSITQGLLGAEYFFAPTVAFGPALFVSHYDSDFKDYQRYGVSFNLSIYL